MILFLFTSLQSSFLYSEEIPLDPTSLPGPEIVNVNAVESTTPTLVSAASVKPKILQPKKKSLQDIGGGTLFDDKAFHGRSLTLKVKVDISNLLEVLGDDYKKGYNDRASSIKYNIPKGWKLTLFEDKNYKKRSYTLTGKGEIPDLGSFSNKTSSIQWSRE